MRLLRRPPRPRAKTFRPAERYLAAAADDARRLGHRYIGTEHLLLGLIRHRDGSATRILQQLGVTPDEVEEALRCWLGEGAPRIDPDALATLGIDFHAVRERLEEAFGEGALERTRAGCLGVCPRAKMALAFAVDNAEGRPVGDEQVLLGMLSVRDSVAARVLADLGISFGAVAALVEGR